jgi:hypothetical protein
MLGTALAIGLKDLSVAGVDLVAFEDCGSLDAGKSVFGMTGHCSTQVASSVAVVSHEDSCIEAGDGGPV